VYPDVQVPRVKRCNYTLKDVIVNKQENSSDNGHYRLLIRGVYYFVHHTALRASGLTQFEITTNPSKTDFSQVPIDHIPSPKLKFGCIVVDEDVIKNGLEDMNTDSMQSVIKSAVVIPNSELPDLFINRSFHIQLKYYFLTLEHGRVYTQTAPFFTTRPT
jgi:vacuolar-type H+-ATPase subunit F/Vma7